MTKRSRENISDLVHVLLSAIIVGFYVMLSVWNHSTILHNIFLIIAVFETVVSFLHVFDVTLIMHIHLLFQSVLFIIPTFVLYSDILYHINEMGTVNFLESYHLEQLKEFVMKKYSLVLSIGIFTVWIGRMVITEKFIVHKIAKKIITASKESSLKQMKLKGQHNFLSDVFNTTTVIFFLIVAYCEEEKLKETFLLLAMFETFMTVFRCAPLAGLHFSFQAVMFSVPCFLVGVLDCYKVLPDRTIAFLESYDLAYIKHFIKLEPTFAVSMMFLFWFARLIDAYKTAIGVATFDRVVYKLSGGIVNERLTRLLKKLET